MSDQKNLPVKFPVKINLANWVVWRILFATTEGRILATGIILSVVGLLIMAITALWSPQNASMMGALTITNIAFGRAVSMSIGYAAGYGHAMVVPVNMVVETILVLLFYPLFIFSLKKLVVFPALKRLLDRAHQAAVQHEDKVRKYGIIGLLIFVWFPFWMTGPVVGCTIGHLLELPVWLNLSVVLIGTYIAMAAWGYVLFSIQSHAADLGSWAPVLIVGIIVAIVVVGYLLNKQRGNNGENN
ncbi:MAG: small multi-drug export protein [Acidiferrobacterales bacterium]